MGSKRRRRARAESTRGPAHIDPLAARRRRLAAVFGAAAAIRLLVVASIHDLPLVRTPKLDSFEYVSWAHRLAVGRFDWPAVSPHGPGYPIFLAALFTLGASLTTVLVVQAFIGAATATLVAVLGERWFGARAGVVAGLLYAASAPVVFVETTVVAEGLLLMLVVGATVLLAVEELTSLRALAAGLLFGAAISVRPTAAFIAVVVAVAAVAAAARVRRAALAAALVAGTAVVTLPVLLVNHSASGTFTIQGFGGLNLYIGNSPLHSGLPSFRLGRGWDALDSEAYRHGIVDPAAQDRYYVARTLGEIREHPAAYVELLGRKALWLVQAAEVRDSHSFYFFADQSAVLRLLPRMAVLLPLAAIGMFEMFRQRKTPALLVAYAVGSSLAVVVFVVGTRYRIPVVPALAIWGGVGLAAVLDWAAARDARRLATASAIAFAAVVASHVLTDGDSTNVSEEWALTGASLVTERRPPDAEAAYRQALALDPMYAFAWDGLGLTLFDERRWDESRDALDRAHRLDPVNAKTDYHLALVDEAQKRLADAAAELQRSLSIDPTDLDAARHLAGDLIQLGRGAEAIPVLDRVLAHDPGDVASYLNRAGALGAIGRLRDAKQDLVTATRLEPDDGDAWIDLCLVSLDLGDVEEGRAALARARALHPSEARLQFATRAMESYAGRR